MFHQSPRDEVARQGPKDDDIVVIEEDLSRQVLPKSISNEMRYSSEFQNNYKKQLK